MVSVITFDWLILVDTGLILLLSPNVSFTHLGLIVPACNSCQHPPRLLEFAAIFVVISHI